MIRATGAQYYGVMIYGKGVIYLVLDAMTREEYLLGYGQECTDQVWINVLAGTMSTWIGTDINQCHGEYQPKWMCHVNCFLEVCLISM